MFLKLRRALVKVLTFNGGIHTVLRLHSRAPLAVFSPDTNETIAEGIIIHACINFYSTVFFVKKNLVTTEVI